MYGQFLGLINELKFHVARQFNASHRNANIGNLNLTHPSKDWSKINERDEQTVHCTGRHVHVMQIVNFTTLHFYWPF